MKHSVVIITRDRREETLLLLRTLREQTAPPDEVILVDAGSPCLRHEEVEGDAPYALSIIPSPPGIAVQRNRGLEAATGDIITFMDDDALPEAGYYAAVNRVFLTDTANRIAAVGGMLRNHRGMTPMERLLRDLFLLQTDRGGNRFRGSGIPDFNVTTPPRIAPHILPSTALSFRREAADGLRFDPACFSGQPLGLDTGRCFGEDAWFTAMLGRCGGVVLLPDAMYTHVPSARNRDRTHGTQALYVYALRMLSDRFASRGAGRMLRRWALAGQGLVAVLQGIRHGDAGYVSGYLRAMRVPLRRLPRTGE